MLKQSKRAFIIVVFEFDLSFFDKLSFNAFKAFSVAALRENLLGFLRYSSRVSKVSEFKFHYFPCI